MENGDSDLGGFAQRKTIPPLFAHRAGSGS